MKKINMGLSILLGLALLGGCNGESGKEKLVKIVDENGISIEGYKIDPKTEIAYEHITQGERYDDVKTALDKEDYEKDGLFLLYDISITLNGEKIQPSQKVKVSIPSDNLNLSQDKDYSIYHLKDENVEKLAVTLNQSSFSFETTSFSYFVLTENHVHDYGAMYYGREATFFEDGNIPYYHCEECGKYFDENYNEVESVILPKLSKEIVLLVDGKKKGDFVIESEGENSILWLLSNISLKRGELIEVASKEDNSKKHDFFPNINSNITKEFKVHNDVENATIDIQGTPNGLYLSISGFDYVGVIVETYRDGEVERREMEQRNYNFGIQVTSYVSGYYLFEENDSFKIIDKDNDLEYGFDDLSDDEAWKTLLLEEGSDNEITLKKDCRIGIEFDINGDKKIYISEVFAPHSGSSFKLEVKGVETMLNMTKTTVKKSDPIYSNIVKIIEDETTTNAYDIQEALSSNGLIIHSLSIDLSANTSIRIYDSDGATIIPNDHLVSLYDFANPSAVLIGDDYITLPENGKYMIIYVECIGAISISYSEPSTPVVDTPPTFIISSASGSESPTMSKNPNNSKIYEIKNRNLLESDLFSIAYAGKNYAYSDIEVGQDLVTSIAGEGYTFIKAKKAGTYDISFNIETKKISIVLIEESSVNVLISCILYDGKERHNMTLVGEEFTYTLDVTPGMYFGFIDQDANAVEDFVLDESSDSSIVTLLGTMIYVIGTGRVTVSIDRTTHIVKVVLA